MFAPQDGDAGNTEIGQLLRHLGADANPQGPTLVGDQQNELAHTPPFVAHAV